MSGSKIVSGDGLSQCSRIKLYGREGVIGCTRYDEEAFVAQFFPPEWTLKQALEEFISPVLDATEASR